MIEMNHNKSINHHRHTHKRILILLLLLCYYSNYSSSTSEFADETKNKLSRHADSASHQQKHIKEEYEEILELLKTGEISKYKINNLHLNNTRNLSQFKGIKNYKTSPIRIKFDTRYLKQSYYTTTEKLKIQTIIKSILPKAKYMWKSILNVIPLETYTIPFDTICKDTVITPYEYKVNGVSNNDLLIFVDAIKNCGSGGGSNTLAFTSICVLDPFTDRPIIGRMTYCLDEIDINPTSSNLINKDVLQKYVKITLHEIGHILGMQVQLFPWFRNTTTGMPLTSRPHSKEKVKCTDGSIQYMVKPSSNTIQPIKTNNIFRYVVTLPTVKQVVQNHFNCYNDTILNGAYLENQDDASFCFGNHWDERYFFSELMGPYYTDIIENNILSAVTLSLLEDSGWYDVNYNDVKNSPFGYGAGCDFIQTDCIEDGNVLVGGDEFCNSQIYFDDDGKFVDKSGGGMMDGVMCDPTHYQKAYCNLVDQRYTPYKIQIPPWQYRYFPDNKFLGPLTILPDYCPIPMYQTYPMSCNDENTLLLPLVHGEEFTSDSRCINVHKNEKSSSACFKTKCNGDLGLVQVIIKDGIYNCDFDGQVYNFYDDFYFECPEFTSVCPDLICPSNCSGKGKCKWDAKFPYCECFDKDDTSDGCYGNDAKNDTIASVKPSLSPTTTATDYINISSVDYISNNTYF